MVSYSLGAIAEAKHLKSNVWSDMIHYSVVDGMTGKYANYNTMEDL